MYITMRMVHMICPAVCFIMGRVRICSQDCALFHYEKGAHSLLCVLFYYGKGTHISLVLYVIMGRVHIICPMQYIIMGRMHNRVPCVII